MGKGVVIQITGDGESAKRALEMVQEHLRETAEVGEHTGHRLAEAMEMAKRALEFAAIDLSIRETIDLFKEIVKGAAEFGEQIVKASQRTGLAVETLSTLHYAASVTGSDFDALVNGISKMNRTIAEAADGNKKASGFVKALGLDAKELATRADGSEIAFHKFLTTLAATQTQMEQTNLAAGFLGSKSGSAQIPVLTDLAKHWDELKQKAEDAGVALTGETAKALEDTSRRMKEMQQQIQGNEMAIAQGFTPAFDQMLSVISGGKPQLEAMKELGTNLGKSFAFVGEVMYSAAAGAEAFFATVEGAGLTQQGRKDRAAADDLLTKAQMMHDVAFGGPKAPKLKEEGESGHEEKEEDGFKGTVGEGKTKAPKSDDGIARAAAELAQEQAKSIADVQKYVSQAQLAELAAQHKLLLVSDAEYFADKLALETDALNAEQKAIEDREKTLNDLLKTQKGDKLLKRNKQGVSAEELKTERELVQLEEQLAALRAKGQELASANNASVGEAGWATELAGLKEAADLEKERNAGITAQLALLQRETEMKARRVSNAGGSDADVANVNALGDQEAGKLRIGEVNRQITETENEYKRAVEQVNDEVSKDPRLKRQGAAEITRLNQEEAQALRGLVAQYDELAAVLGGPYIEQARALHAELDKLNRPDQREGAAFAKTLAEGVEGMTKRVVDATQEGRESWHKMAKGMEKDALDLAIKLAEQKWITPLLEGGAKLPQTQVGGAPAGIASLAALTPQLYQPKSSGFSPVTSLLPKFLGGGGKDGKEVKFTVKIDNQTSQPVSMQQTGQSYDSETDEYIVNAILRNMNGGGILGSVFGGG